MYDSVGTSLAVIRAYMAMESGSQYIYSCLQYCHVIVIFPINFVAKGQYSINILHNIFLVLWCTHYIDLTLLIFGYLLSS